MESTLTMNNVSFNLRELTLNELFLTDGGINWYAVAGGALLVAAAVAIAVFVPAAPIVTLVVYAVSRTGVGVAGAGFLM
jgi:hypothetical protein